MMRRKSNTEGFTLVELSIVLVIIGLIIGGVLTGRQIMQNAQITNTINSIQAYEAQFQTYVQNYGAIPGDDSNAASRFTNANLPTSVGDGNGTLAGSFDSALSSDESRLLWADLRAAELVKGAGSNTAQPINSFGGIFGIQHGAFTGSPLFATNVLCLNSVPGDAAGSIDSRLDDGNSNTGTVMSMVSTGKAGEAYQSGSVSDAYDSAQTYTMCVKI